MAAMLAHDPHCVIEAKPKPRTWRLSGEERLKDALLQLRRDAGAVIPNLHQKHVRFKPANHAFSQQLSPGQSQEAESTKCYGLGALPTEYVRLTSTRW